MDDAQITLIKESWARVEPIAPTAAVLFYDRLFTVAPGVRPLFPDDMTQQRLKLMQMLGFVVNGLDNLDLIVSETQALGRRHADYGAEPAHFDVVGECLLWTLGQGLGEAFTAETKEAWAAAYGVLSTVMIDAQDEATRTAA